MADDIVGPEVNGQPYPGLVFASASSGFSPVVINQSVYGNQLDIYHQFAILLHEIGHVTGVLDNADGLPGSPAQQANDAEIDTKCAKTIKSNE